MRTVVATMFVAVGALWLADVLLNEGRYGDVVEGAIMTLVGR
jgi:hypothetical protein